MKSLAQIDELAGGLLDFEGVNCVDNLRVLMLILPPSDGDDDDRPGMSFYDFLIWARRLRDIEMKELWIQLESHSKGDHRVESEDVPALARKMGYSMIQECANEIMQSVDVDPDESLDFDTIFAFIRACHERHGFMDWELQKLITVFEKFDLEGDGELPMLQVQDLLNFMGYSIPIEDVNTWIAQVDYNENGSMDKGEFLRLMRLQREQEFSAARDTFAKWSRRGARPAR
jgi:Ca2+-binding EF-hand superfamily protein